MAGTFGGYWQVNILRTITGSQVMTQQTYWLAACTAAPMTAGGTNMALAECQATNTYAYTRYGLATSIWKAVSGSTPASVGNTTIINYNTATPGAWGTIAYLAIMNTSTVRTGDILAWGPCTNTVVGTGDTLRIATGSLVLSIT